MPDATMPDLLKFLPPELDRDQHVPDIVRPGIIRLLVHDAVEPEIGQCLVDIKFYQAVDLGPGIQGLVIRQLFQKSIGGSHAVFDKGLKQFLL